jgi:hypothetical protein
MLQSLTEIEGAAPLREDICRLLLKARSPNWSFNYWLRDSPESQQFPYPDDLDDTFCALIGLYKHNPNLIDEAALARIVHLLLASETTVGGPYRTWLVKPDSPPEWLGVDVAVNANIAYFLQLIGSPSPPLLQYLAAKIMQGDYASDYYPNPVPIWYYLARVCPAGCRKKLRQDIEATRPTNALQLALSISALRQLGAPVQRRQKTLRNLQSNDGSWPAAAFCLDPARDGQTYYHGSAALTTAFALEALVESPKVTTKPASPIPKLQGGIVEQARSDIEELGPDLRKQALLALERTLKSDPKHQITLLPYWVGQSLRKPPPADEQFYGTLGLANLFGWMAYTIYDDFLDDAGQPPQLPVANFALRSSVGYFRAALPNHAAFQHHVNQTFNIIDNANAWEQAHCRSVDKPPRYGARSKLAERSMGHVLTPVAVLLQAGQTLTSSDVVCFQKAFHHYLIARQLDDDMHDWQTDFTNGHVSYVVAEILRANASHNMQQQFWHHTLPRVCDVMNGHIVSARGALKQVKILKPDNVLAQLLDNLETSVQTTLTKQTQATKFLASYRQISK